MYTTSYTSPLGQSGTVSVHGPAGVKLMLMIDLDPRLHLNEFLVAGTAPRVAPDRPVVSGISVYDDAGEPQVALSALVQGF